MAKCGWYVGVTKARSRQVKLTCSPQRVGWSVYMGPFKTEAQAESRLEGLSGVKRRRRR